MNQQEKKGSTLLLILTVVFFPVLWLMDPASMSMWWTARFPPNAKPKPGGDVHHE